jgi:hypothetical protein
LKNKEGKEAEGMQGGYYTCYFDRERKGNLFNKCSRTVSSYRSGRYGPKLRESAGK